MRQFRYYLATQDLPRVALRFLDAVRRTTEDLRKHPHIGPRYKAGDSRLQNLRSWPVTGFEAIRVYYIPDDKVIHVIRVLHGKRDVEQILKRDTNV